MGNPIGFVRGYDSAGDGITLLDVVPGSVTPSPTPALADDGQVLALDRGEPTWNPAQNPIQDGLSLLDLPQGFAFAFVPSMRFGRVVDVTTGLLTALRSLPPNDVLARAFAPFKSPAIAEGRYRGQDGLLYTAPAGGTMLQANVTPIPAGAAEPVTVIVVGALSATAEGVALGIQTAAPNMFQAGPSVAPICFDDSAGNTIAYPPSDLRGLSVLSWVGSIGAAGSLAFRINGAQVASGAAPTAPTGNAGASIGQVFSTSRGWDGPLEAVVIYNRILTPAELAAAETFFVQYFGTVRHPDFLSDNGDISSARANTNFGASFASTRVRTSATALVAIYSASGGASSQVWVIVDGELYQAFDVPADGATHAFTVEFDGRSHVVEFWDGLQIDVSSNTVTATLRELRGAFTLLPKAIGDTRVSVYGNSITQGALAGFVPLGGVEGIAGWWQLWRLDPAFPGRLSNIGSGGRELHTDFLLDPTMALLANWLVSQAQEVVTGNRKTIWYAGIELNDWQGAAWAPAPFGVALAALVANILGADTDVRIVLQSSIVALNQAVPNGLGFTLAQYRAEVQAVAAANPDRVIFLDGLAADNGAPALVVGDLQDDVHPSPAGHIKLSAWAKALPALQYSFAVPFENLIAWYRADQGIVPSGPNVGAWDSFGRSGDAARNAIGGPGTEPVLPVADATLNNELALVFAQGGNGALVTGVWSAGALAGPITIYLVAYATAGANKFFFDSLPADVPANRVVLYDAGGNLPTLRVAATDIPATGGVDGSTPHVYALIIDPASTEMYVDDMAISNASLSPAPAVTPTGLTIGNDQTKNNALGGGFGELMIYRGRHTEAQRATVAAYLKARYGTP